MPATMPRFARASRGFFVAQQAGNSWGDSGYRMSDPFAIAILTGGHSSRMGQPKEWLQLDGQPLLSRLCERLSLLRWPIVVVARAGQDLPPLPTNVTVLRDTWPGAGPMGGLATALSQLPAGCDAAVVIPVDAPGITPEVVAWLGEQLGEHRAAVVCDDSGRWHPLLGAYSALCAASAMNRVVAGQLKLQDWLDELSPRALSYGELRTVDPELRSLANWNAPADLDAS